MEQVIIPLLGLLVLYLIVNGVDGFRTNKENTNDTRTKD